MENTIKSPKVYVAVRVAFREDGTMIPKEITWEDGLKYRIDKVTDIRQAAAFLLAAYTTEYLPSQQYKLHYVQVVCTSILLGEP